MEHQRDEKETRSKYIYGALIALLAIVSAFAAVQYNKVRKYEISMENNYSRAFYEMAQYVDDIEVSLAKGMMINDPYQMVKLSSDVSQYAEGAIASLGQLPQNDAGLQKTAKFLTQVGDYTYSVSMRHMDGSPLSQEESDQLTALGKYAKELGADLDEMRSSLGGSTISFDQVRNIGSGADESLFDGMAELENTFQEYPSLIYDGPFSDHIEGLEPQMLSGKDEVGEQAAIERMQRLLGDKAEGVEIVGKGEGKIPTYNFSAAKENEQIDLEISRKGGYVVNMLISRSIGDIAIETQDAKNKAAAFLQQQNIPNMKESYYEVKNGIATINYAYEQDGITIYPDLIKVKVAMDNGEIIGMETTGYLTHHTERNLDNPTVTKEQALTKVNSRLQVESVTRAVIPTEAKGEKNCYEIKGKFEDVSYLVYINVVTGRVEDVLMLMEDAEGTLAL